MVVFVCGCLFLCCVASILVAAVIVAGSGISGTVFIESRSGVSGSA